MHFYSSTRHLQMLPSAFLLLDNQVYIFQAFYLFPTPQGRNAYLPPQNFVLIIYLSQAYLFPLKISTNWNLRVSTSGARMKHNVHGSLLTNAHLCEQTHSATARHEYAAQRNTNDTETTNLNLGVTKVLSYIPLSSSIISNYKSNCYNQQNKYR